MRVLYVARTALTFLLALNLRALADTYALTQPVDQGIQIELIEPQDAGILAHKLVASQEFVVMGKILAQNEIIVATVNGAEVSLLSFKQGGGATFFAKLSTSDHFEIVVMDREGNKGVLQLIRVMGSHSGTEGSVDTTDPTRIVRAKVESVAGAEHIGVTLRGRGRTAGEMRVHAGSGAIVYGGIAGYAGFVDFGYSHLVGQVFPGDAGGWWHGLAIEPRAQVGYMRLEKREVCKRIATTTYEKCSGGYMYDTFDWQAGLTLGYEILRFDARDNDNIHTRGWGLKLGAFGGAVGRGSDAATFAVAPVLSLLRPSYQANTGNLHSWSINLMVLPQKATTLFVGAGLGF